MFSKEYAVKLCQEKGLIYWRIEDPKNPGLVAVDQVEKIDPSQSAHELNYALDNLNGVYRITLRKEPFPNQTGRRPKGEDYTFLVSLKPAPVNSSGSVGINGISLDTYLSLSREKTNLEIELLKKEFEERDTGIFEAFAKKALETPEIMSGIGNLLNAFTGTKKQVNVDTTITGAKVQIKAETINKLAQSDPDISDTLDLLAKWMEQNPGQIELIKSTIKSQVK